MLTTDQLRIVIAASEAVPFAKTGGLADVSTALAKALDQIGHDVTLIMPDYRVLRKKRQSEIPNVSSTGMRVTISMNGRPVTAGVNWTTLPGTQVRVLLIAVPEYFDRSELYMQDGEGFSDNCERYCFFSRAVLDICQQMVIRPDILHANDWQTGLIPALLNSSYANRPGFENAASVMTLHNMAYQGRFWHLDMKLTGMEWHYFNLEQMEMWGDLNLLKTGIAFADQITTVSPTYAGEVCTTEGGEGLHDLLAHRSGDLTGILNGIDDQVWNPTTDPLLPASFSVDKVQPGKAACKAELQKRVGLPAQDGTPLIGMVSRMSDQKGFDLIAECFDRLVSHDVQYVFLGTGDPKFEQILADFSSRYPDKVAVMIGFDEGLAHLIEAGSDLFLMPSRFEPCGLNQMYSLRYGTLPIVRRVGGLADSVVDTNDQTLKDGTATGFVFNDYDAAAMADCIECALSQYQRKDQWNGIQKNGMSIDWSWQSSAQRYLEVYHQARERRAGRGPEGRC